jgi:hypothetical protein
MATTTQSGRVLAETEAGGQVVRLSGSNDEMTLWGAQRATGAKPGDAVTVHRSASGPVATWWATKVLAICRDCDLSITAGNETACSACGHSLCEWCAANATYWNLEPVCVVCLCTAGGGRDA